MASLNNRPSYAESVVILTVDWVIVLWQYAMVLWQFVMAVAQFAAIGCRCVWVLVISVITIFALPGLLILAATVLARDQSSRLFTRATRL